MPRIAAADLGMRSRSMPFQTGSSNIQPGKRFEPASESVAASARESNRKGSGAASRRIGSQEWDRARARRR